jgi:DNA-binding transcriptional LysR family regulator
VDVPVELRELRYFVAVAEELHFGRAADRLHMSQSPLSRAIRDLERALGVVLFVRTTRRVELTEAGSLLLERVRRPLADIDRAVADARGAGESAAASLRIGFTPVTRIAAIRIGEEAKAREAGLDVQFAEDVSQELLPLIAAGALTAAAVMRIPGAARRYGVRIDALRDEPLLAALPSAHPCASAGVIPIATFASERVLLPQEPAGQFYNAWLRSVIRAAGFELERTVQTVSAQWDRRMLPVANGEAVGVVVAEWAEEWSSAVVAVPFDPPLTIPLDLASPWPPSGQSELVLAAACRLRDAETWLTERPPRTELPTD